MPLMILLGMLTNGIGLWIARTNGRLIGTALEPFQALWVFSGGFLVGAILIPSKAKEYSDATLDQAFGGIAFLMMPIAFALLFGFFRLIEMDHPNPNVPRVSAGKKRRISFLNVLHLCALVGIGLGRLSSL